MAEHNIRVKDLKEEHIDPIGCQIRNPENDIKFMMAKLIKYQNETIEEKKQITNLKDEIDVSTK